MTTAKRVVQSAADFNDIIHIVTPNGRVRVSGVRTLPNGKIEVVGIKSGRSFSHYFKPGSTVEFVS